jgi:hypothetical protein
MANFRDSASVALSSHKYRSDELSGLQLTLVAVSGWISSASQAAGCVAAVAVASTVELRCLVRGHQQAADNLAQVVPHQLSREPLVAAAGGATFDPPDGHIRPPCCAIC